MRKITISVIAALSLLIAPNMAEASDIRVYKAKELVKVPNIHNMEHAVKQRIELEAKLLQWTLTEPLREISRIPSNAIQSVPPINRAPRAPEAPTLEQKVQEWKVIECQRFGRCD
jgi:hypothetical protein